MFYLIHNKTTKRGVIHQGDYHDLQPPINDDVRVIAVGGQVVAESKVGETTFKDVEKPNVSG